MYMLMVSGKIGEEKIKYMGGNVQDIYQFIAEKIKEERNKQNLTQEELAERARISSKFLSNIERNRKKASLETVSKIVQSLGIGLDNFFSSVSKKKQCTLKSSAKLSWLLEGLSSEEADNLVKIVKLILKK